MRRRLVIAAAAVVFVALVCTVGVMQVARPLWVSFTDAIIATWTHEGSYPGMIERGYTNGRNGLASDVQLLSDQDVDFSNPADFAQIGLAYHARSVSVFPITDIEFSVTGTAGIKGRFLYRQDQLVPVSAGPGQRVEVNLILFMRVKGLSDDEVAGLVSELGVELRFKQGSLGAKTESVSIPSDLVFSQRVTD